VGQNRKKGRASLDTKSPTGEGLNQPDARHAHKDRTITDQSRRTMPEHVKQGRRKRELQRALRDITCAVRAGSLTLDSASGLKDSLNKRKPWAAGAWHKNTPGRENATGETKEDGGASLAAEVVSKKGGVGFKLLMKASGGRG